METVDDLPVEIDRTLGVHRLLHVVAILSCRNLVIKEFPHVKILLFR